MHAFMTGRNALNQNRSSDYGALLVDFGAGTDGHRRQYNAMLAELFPLRRAPMGLRTLFTRGAVLVPQIEAAPLRFVLTSLVRAMLGLRTAGLLLRPLPTLHGKTLRLRAKRAALSALRRVPGVRVLTIIPFAAEPGQDRIAHGWIHDLQWWDQGLGCAADPVVASETARSLCEAAGSRLVCCAIGGQNRAKGFDRFAGFWAASDVLRESMLFAFAGKTSGDVSAAVRQFSQSGGFAIDRFASDAELAGFYDAADLIWCAYHPDYDQASGVLGRAFQNGVPAAVRAGSVAERLCRLAGHPHLSLDEGSAQEDLLDLPGRRDYSAVQALVQEYREHSLAVLAEALGITAADGQGIA